MAGEEGRRERVRAWAAGREREKYGGGEKGSSEDVWEARRWKVAGAFGGDWADLVRGVGEGEGEGK